MDAGCWALHLGDTFWQPDLRMCLFAVGTIPDPEKPAEYISPHMRSASLSHSSLCFVAAAMPNWSFVQRP